MKRVLLGCLLLLILNAAAFADSDRTVVKVGIYENQPMIFKGAAGRGKGIFADILEFVAEKENWALQYVNGSLQSMLEMLDNGQIDILCAIAYSPQRAARYDFTRENLVASWAQVFTPTGATVASFNDLHGHRVAVLEKDIHAQAFNALQEDFGIRCDILACDDYHQVLTRVAQKEAAAGIVSRFFGMLHANRYGVRKSGMVFNPIKFHYAATAGRANQYLAAMDRHIRALKQDEHSVLHQSLERWLGAYSSKKQLPGWVLWAGGITFGGLFLLGLHTIVLRRLINRKTRDVTEELALCRKTESELRKAEARWQFALQGAGDGVWDWDVPSGRMQFSWNGPTMLGFEDHEVLHTFEAWQAIIHPDDKAQVLADVARHTNGETPIFINEHRLLGKDNQYRWFQARGKVIEHGTDHSPVRVIGTFTDITERRQWERALRESEQRLNAILQANPDPMVIYDPEGLPQYINPAFTTIFGWTLEEVAGARIPFVPEDQKHITRTMIAEIYRKQSAVVFETRRLTKDGRNLAVIVSAALIQPGDASQPTGMIVNLTDVTERKLLEAQYEQAQKMESLGTLAGGIAHDFNNLLMGIQGRASLMLAEVGDGHRLREHLIGIETYVRSAADLTKQLLGFARGGKYEVKPTDLNALVNQSASMFGRTRKEIAITTELGDALPAVEVDGGQIEHVLLNIFVNAWQAMPGGGTLHIQTGEHHVDAQQAASHHVPPGHFVMVAIADTGTGIDESLQHRIFDPFFTTKDKDRGTGLGLASAYGIIRNHGGFITVASKAGVGTTFQLYLPASDKTSHMEMDVQGTPVKGDGTILLVDDEPMILEVGQAMLERLGYRVVTADCGQAAIDAVQAEDTKFDLVILDLIMPGMDGGVTFDRIKAVDPDQMVLLSSGYAINGQAEAVLQRGCNGFIQKPFNIEALSNKIRTILESSSTAVSQK